MNACPLTGRKERLVCGLRKIKMDEEKKLDKLKILYYNVEGRLFVFNKIGKFVTY